jgi:acyl carrier protein
MRPFSMEDIQERLRMELQTILGRELEASDDNRPLHELGVDSMSLVELLVAIEREFDLRLMESNVTSEDLRTIRGLAAVIHRA